MTDKAWWQDKRVFITGHTGFKGAWLSHWLSRWGATLGGMSLPPTQPSLFAELDLASRMESHIGDIRDADLVMKRLREFEPEIVFHMAAQPLVRLSYREPIATYATNVMGTIHVLEAARATSSVRAIIGVTSDKCYANKEWPWGYRENDPMGGHDPYSSSKGACELVIDAWRKSYFSGRSGPRLASVRAGNVIGGGDWAEDRLIPDIVRAFEAGVPVVVRSPRATRPWQHVLEPLSGYMTVAQKLVDEGADWAEPWNFGPSADDIRPVGDIIAQMVQVWGDGAQWRSEEEADPEKRIHEAQTLALDSSKARQRLGWRPVWTLEQTLNRIVDWSKRRQAGVSVASLCDEEIESYVGAR